MNIAKEHHAIEFALNTYQSCLEIIPDELFGVTPPGGGWSYAEVYSHILKATLGASISLEKCSNPNIGMGSNGLTFLGILMMLTGRFPPFKVKVPKTLAEKMPVEKISKDDAKKLLEKCRRRINVILPLAESLALNGRSKHPRLGMLNARQWLKFIRIHAEHHLKQLDRIKNKFK